MPHADQFLMQRLAERIRAWFVLWGVEDSDSPVEIRVSTRMTRSIGSADGRRNRMTLAVWLFNQPEEIVNEVVCHEAAHLAVFRSYGTEPKPHGREWRTLMRHAGFPPRTRLEVPFPPSPTGRRRGRRTLSVRPVTFLSRLIRR